MVSREADGFGCLDHVTVRDIWEDEARDFTPWLANTKNIELLGEAIGISLEVITDEGSVDPFRADNLPIHAG